jgi:DNA modification methylase
MWQNNIIGYDTKPADQFLANELNHRTHPANQRRAMRASLDDIGWVAPVIENQQSGRLLDGHERVWQALQNDNADVPYILVDVPESEEGKIIATFDQIGAMAEIDTEKLDALLQDIQTDNADLMEFLSDFAEGEGLYFGEETPEDDPGPQIDKAEELREKWGVESGQMWQLGDHRIICGDCTDAAVVDRLMGGEKAGICITDPPYGVKYTGGTKKWTMLENDDEVNMYGASLPLIYEYTEEKAALYLAFASANARSVYNSIEDNRYAQRALIIWNKNHAQFGAMGSQYKQKHEPIMYCYKKGQSPYWFGPNNEVTVWDIDRSSVNEFHPTQKPIELYERALINSSKIAFIAYEPFLGSGTSVIACERLNRQCRGIEIEPKYIAVTLERWHEMTGREPVLITDVTI